MDIPKLFIRLPKCFWIEIEFKIGKILNNVNIHPRTQVAFVSSCEYDIIFLVSSSLFVYTLLRRNKNLTHIYKRVSLQMSSLAQVTV